MASSTGDTPSQRLHLVKRVFMEALDVPPAKRAAFLEKACGGDTRLQREVLELFLIHGEHDEWLDRPLDGAEAFAELAQPKEGQVGPYRLVRELGRGGMGVVHLAERGGQRVALKLLAAGSLSPELRERFRLEAEILMLMDHPGLARVLEMGESPGPGGITQPWLAMEHVEGRPLLRYASETELSLEGRLRLMVAVCEAVQHAHARGVVHRDLKPSNILVRTDGRPVVLDFGVARLVAGDERPTELATRTGQLVGTPQYMSPEQVQAEPAGVGPASDVYSLGVVLYELLSGRVPYEASSVSLHRAVVTILTSEPVPLGRVAPELRGPLERVVMMALEKEPHHRYPDAGSLGDDLRRRLEGRRVRARGPGLTRRIRRWSRRRRRLAAGLAALLGVAALATAWGIGAGRVMPKERVLANYREAETLVLAAVPLLYEGERTPARMRQAVGVLTQARTLIEDTPPLSHRAVLLRQLEKDLGTAQMLLGEMDWDLLAARQAVLTLERALDTPFDTNPARLRDRQLAEIGEAPIPDDQIRGILASAHLSLHRLWGESGSIRRSLALSLGTLADYRRAEADPALMPWYGPGTLRAQVGFAYNALAEAGTDLAWYLNTAEAARQATVWSDSAYAHRLAFEQDWPALGSLRFQRGRAFFALGTLARWPAALDTAELYLRASAAYRGAERPRIHAETNEEFARLAMARTRLTDDPVKRRALLMAALHHLERGDRALVSAGAIPPQTANMRSKQAVVFAELAMATRSRAWLDSAASRIREAEGMLPPTSYPRTAALYWLRLASVEQARFQLTHAPEAREASLEAFERARVLGRTHGDSLILGRVDRAIARGTPPSPAPASVR